MAAKKPQTKAPDPVETDEILDDAPEEEPDEVPVDLDELEDLEDVDVEEVPDVVPEEDIAEDELDEDSDDDEEEEEHDEETADALEELESQELQLLEEEANEAMLVDEVEELRAMRRAELTMNVDAHVQRADEFVCQSCFMVKRMSQLANKRKMICRDCVD